MKFFLDALELLPDERVKQRRGRKKKKLNIEELDQNTVDLTNYKFHMPPCCARIQGSFWIEPKAYLKLLGEGCNT